MKKLRILCYMVAVMLAFCIDAKSVTCEFVKPGKIWHRVTYTGYTMECGDNYNGPDESYDLQFAENCDTVINDVVYKKLTYQNVVHRNINTKKNGAVYALLREENGRVYVYDDSKKRDILLYDFTLNKGDRFELEKCGGSGVYSCVVDDVVEVTYGGKNYKTIRLSSLYSAREEEEDDEPVITTWTEGIGGDEPVCQPLEDNNIMFGAYELQPYVSCTDGQFFAVQQSLFGWAVQGDRMPTDENVTDLVAADKYNVDDLMYEITADNKLHVSGAMWVNASLNQYLWLLGKIDGNGNCYMRFLADEEFPQIGHRKAYKVNLYYKLPERSVYECLYVADGVGEHKVNDTSTSIRDIPVEGRHGEIYDISGKRYNSVSGHGVYIYKGNKMAK